MPFVAQIGKNLDFDLTVSENITVGTAAGRCALLYGFSTSTTVVSATFNGVNAPLLASGTDANGKNYALFGVMVDGTGILTGSVTFGAVGGVKNIQLMTFDGIASIRGGQASHGASTTPATNIATIANDIVALMGTDYPANAAFAAVSPAVTRNASGLFFAADEVATGASTFIDGTLAVSGVWSAPAAALVPAAPPGLQGSAQAVSSASAAFPGTQNLAGSAAAQATATAAFHIPTITSDVLKNNAGTVLANTVIPKVAVLKLLDMTLVLNLTNQTTNASGQLVITSAALNLTNYLIVLSDATGAAKGAGFATAA